MVARVNEPGDPRARRLEIGNDRIDEKSRQAMALSIRSNRCHHQVAMVLEDGPGFVPLPLVRRDRDDVAGIRQDNYLAIKFSMRCLGLPCDKAAHDLGYLHHPSRWRVADIKGMERRRVRCRCAAKDHRPRCCTGRV